MREPISLKTRFDVLKRDRFTCQYCGARPPKIEIRVDHIVPVAHGGSSDTENLITACFECNAGKRDSEVRVFALERRVWDRVKTLPRALDDGEDWGRSRASDMVAMFEAAGLGDHMLIELADRATDFHEWVSLVEHELLVFLAHWEGIEIPSRRVMS